METFSQTSNDPYLRHHYKIISEKKEFIVDNYADVIKLWYSIENPICIEVLDLKEEKTKGFGAK